MKVGENTMKLLQIENNQGFFLDEKSDRLPVHELDKKQLLWLVNQTLDDSIEIEFDEYDVDKLRNQAHQIVYKSVYEKLIALRERRREFVDTSERLYLADYEKYRQDAT